jgi:glycyl-tRNA synthetase alpha subunit
MPLGMLTFQQLIQRLSKFWDDQGCVLLQPYLRRRGSGCWRSPAARR